MRFIVVLLFIACLVGGAHADFGSLQEFCNKFLYSNYTEATSQCDTWIDIEIQPTRNVKDLCQLVAPYDLIAYTVKNFPDFPVKNRGFSCRFKDYYKCGGGAILIDGVCYEFGSQETYNENACSENGKRPLRLRTLREMSWLTTLAKSRKIWTTNKRPVGNRPHTVMTIGGKQRKDADQSKNAYALYTGHNLVLGTAPGTMVLDLKTSTYERMCTYHGTITADGRVARLEAVAKAFNGERVDDRVFVLSSGVHSPTAIKNKPPSFDNLESVCSFLPDDMSSGFAAPTKDVKTIEAYKTLLKQAGFSHAWLPAYRAADLSSLAPLACGTANPQMSANQAKYVYNLKKKEAPFAHVTKWEDKRPDNGCNDYGKVEGVAITSEGLLVDEPFFKRYPVLCYYGDEIKNPKEQTRMKREPSCHENATDDGNGVCKCNAGYRDASGEIGQPQGTICEPCSKSDSTCGQPSSSA